MGWLESLMDAASEYYDNAKQTVSDAYDQYVSPVVTDVQQQLDQPIGNQFAYNQQWTPEQEQYPPEAAQTVGDWAYNIADESQNVADTANQIYEAEPAPVQLMVGLAAGEALNNATLNSPAGKVVTAYAPVVGKAIGNLPIFQKGVDLVKGSSPYIDYAREGKKLVENIGDGIIGTLPEAYISSDQGFVPENSAILTGNRLLSNNMPLYKRFAMQYLENKAQDKAEGKY